MDDVLYEKCDRCHLFVVPVDDDKVPVVYEHLHRGDSDDTTLDESHEAVPSGRRANLLTWKTYGPLPMRERFTQ